MEGSTEFLMAMYREGVRFWINNDRLHYRAPRGALTPSQIAMITSLKEEIIEVLQEEQDLSEIPLPIGRRLTSDPVPLTFAQEGCWKWKKKLPSLNFLMPYSFRIFGALNVEALQASLSEVVRRHESLRTRFVVIDGVPTQRIDEPVGFEMAFVDLSIEAASTELSNKTQNAIEQFFKQPMDLEVGPLFAVMLLRVADKEHVLAVAIDHTVSDVMSIRIVIREIWTLYRDFVKGQPLSLPEVSLQYADIAIWQRHAGRNWLEKNAGDIKRRLDGASRIQWPVEDGVQGLPPDFSWILFHFDKSISSGLHDVARNKKTLPALVVLALLSAVVAVWCNQRDFVLPFTVSGRYGSDMETVTGFLADSLLLRIELKGSESLSDLLNVVTKEFLGAWERPDFGRCFEEMAHLLGGTGMNWLPSGSNEYTGEPTPSDWSESDMNLRIEEFDFKINPLENMRFEGENDTYRGISLMFRDTKEGIGAAGLYRVDLVSADAAARFARDLVLVSEQFVRDPSVHFAAFREHCISDPPSLK